MPLTGPESVYKAYGLVRQLDRFQRGSRLFVVPFGKAQQRLASSGSGRLQIVAQRRLMLKTAQAMARRVRADALVTGDSLGQVASQTLANITALDEAVRLPILRPLIGLDKTEIMAEARRISTLALSQLPDQDCCSLLLPRQVETRARVADLHKIEARLDVGRARRRPRGLSPGVPARLTRHRRRVGQARASDRLPPGQQRADGHGLGLGGLHQVPARAGRASSASRSRVPRCRRRPAPGRRRTAPWPAPGARRR